MKEINYIIQTVSSNSLVIIDELGRGKANVYYMLGSQSCRIGVCWRMKVDLHLLKVKWYFVINSIKERERKWDIENNMSFYTWVY